MTTWTSDELNKIGKAEELLFASLRSDGTLQKPVTIGSSAWAMTYTSVPIRTHLGLVPRHPGAPRRSHPGRRH